jgi:hypothetical protein
MASSALDDLRSAAKVLRERAKAATRGPWVAHTDGLVWAGRLGDPVSGSTLVEDAEYIATVHPAVGLALAQLLDEHADSVEEDGGQVVTSSVDQAVTLARLILGRADA